MFPVYIFCIEDLAASKTSKDLISFKFNVTMLDYSTTSTLTDGKSVVFRYLIIALNALKYLQSHKSYYYESAEAMVKVLMM